MSQGVSKERISIKCQVRREVSESEGRRNGRMSNVHEEVKIGVVPVHVVSR